MACVPQDQLESVQWAVQTDARRQARFVSYALCAAAEALQHAGWHPSSTDEKAMTGVAIGVGMSSTRDIADAGVLVSQVRVLQPCLWLCTLVRPQRCNPALVQPSHSIGMALQVPWLQLTC